MAEAAQSTGPHPAAALAERRLREHRQRFLGSAQVWLFGSRARGDALRRSDFDLALQPGTGFEERDLHAFEDAVRDDPEIIYPVDVVDLRHAPAALRDRVRREGVPWTS